MRKNALFAAVNVLVGLVAYLGAQSRDTPPVFVAIYEKGPAWVEAASPFEQPDIGAHIRHHEALEEKLIAAAPFSMLPGDTTVGIIVFEAASTDDATAWLSSDPGIVSGVLSGRVREWRVNSIRAFRASGDLRSTRGGKALPMLDDPKEPPDNPLPADEAGESDGASPLNASVLRTTEGSR